MAAVEASLRPGMHFVVHVRALAEIGTDDAGGILERQLQRRLTEDQIEQSWYWIDLANSLRSLNREESLPLLLRCVAETDEFPLVHYFAAETVSFLGFAGYAKQFGTCQGRAALRLLHRALEGLRFGVSPHVLAEARMGPAITAREREVLAYIAAGHANKQIAAELSISEFTVKRHVSHILEKLAVNDRAQAVVEGLRRGLVRLRE